LIPALAAPALLLLVAAAASGPGCGLSPGDWCAAPPRDPCGRHPNERACRADPRCVGLPYRGESVVACMPDRRGFWSNCPAVGCVSRPRRE
jgi:hypothetical protein